MSYLPLQSTHCSFISILVLHQLFLISSFSCQTWRFDHRIFEPSSKVRSYLLWGHCLTMYYVHKLLGCAHTFGWKYGQSSRFPLVAGHAYESKLISVPNVRILSRNTHTFLFRLRLLQRGDLDLHHTSPASCTNRISSSSSFCLCR